MKKLIFAIPLLALALTFTYCSKENTTETIEQNSQNAVADRGGDCTIKITADIPVLVCGLANNNIACQHCQGIGGVGLSFPATFHQFTFNNNGVMRYFSIVNNNTTQATGLIQTATGATLCFILAPGECRYIGVIDCTYFLAQANDC